MNIDKEVATLERLPVNALRQRYAEVFGEPTNGNCKPWLIRRIAWRLQERAEGGLSEHAQRRAAELADDADLRVRPARKPATAAARPHPPVSRSRILALGTIITRTYKDKSLAVPRRTPWLRLLERDLPPALRGCGPSVFR